MMMQPTGLAPDLADALHQVLGPGSEAEAAPSEHPDHEPA